jgi:hypothetical protein
MRNSGLVVIGLLAFSWLAFGQASDGNLVGTISDSTKAAVPNAIATIKNLSTGIQAVTKTSGTGEYRFNNLPVGQYDLSAQAPGFTTGWATSISN